MPRPNAIMPRRRMFRNGFALLALAGLCAACGGRQEPAAPLALPAGQAKPVEAEGVRFQAQAFEDPRQAAQAFGIDLRGAGLLPVRISISNHGSGAVKVVPRQTFLIDLDGQAWPLLTAGQASSRLGAVAAMPAPTPTPTLAPTPAALDALTGFALDMLAGPAFVGEAEGYTPPGKGIGQDLADQVLRNPSVPAGQVASGVLFFPGREEAHGARGLRLCYAQGGNLKFLVLPLQAVVR